MTADADRAVDELRAAARRTGRSPAIVIVGAGAGGIAAGIQLARSGIDTFTIVDRASGVGGTWRDNTYPGAACDIPSHLYSFSFAPNPDWTRKFAPQAEILAYLERCCDEFGLRSHLRLDAEVLAITWDDSTARWILELRGCEPLVADVVIAATGQLNRPHLPAIADLESFSGTVFHSARWDHRHRLDGESVGVVGNAASAVQFVPEIAPLARELTIFQRSANWVLPKPDREYHRVERALMRWAPMIQRISRERTFWRFEANHAVLRRRGVIGRLLRRVMTRALAPLAAEQLPTSALVPDYAPGCKRILISNDWYPTLRRPGVRVELDPIVRAVPDGLVTGTGTHHRLDTIIFATGFESTRFLAPMRITGVGGAELSRRWAEGAEAYLGTCVSGFPNLFILYGPNTNLGHNSVLYMIESQLVFVMRCLARLLDTGLAVVEVRPAAVSAFRTRLDSELERLVWAEDCGSWYKTADGRVTNNWPGLASSFRRRARRPQPADFTWRRQVDDVRGAKT